MKELGICVRGDMMNVHTGVCDGNEEKRRTNEKRKHCVSLVRQAVFDGTKGRVCSFM
jgi:hypothetical protein